MSAPKKVSTSLCRRFLYVFPEGPGVDTVKVFKFFVLSNVNDPLRYFLVSGINISFICLLYFTPSF